LAEDFSERDAQGLAQSVDKARMSADGPWASTAPTCSSGAVGGLSFTHFPMC
jgi:hypothetical protein